MGSEYQTPSPQMLMARDEPKVHIDPAIVLFCKESWPILLATAMFHLLLFQARKARISGYRHLPVVQRGAMITWHIGLIVLLFIQWFSYLDAFLALDKEFPDQISTPTHNAVAISAVFSIILGCFVILTLLSLWRPRYLLGDGPARIDEESRHNDGADDAHPLPNPDHYNQNSMSWLIHISLVFAWLITSISMQAKLPGASYKNMPNAEKYPPSGLQIPLNVLAECFFWLGLAGWAILTFVMFQFGKVVVLFRIDVTNRCMEVWNTYKAGREVRRSNGRELENEPTYEGSLLVRRWDSWNSNISSASTIRVAPSARTRYAPSPVDIRPANPSLETVVEASGSEEPREEGGPSSWTSLDEDLATPPVARVRN